MKIYIISVNIYIRIEVNNITKMKKNLRLSKMTS